MAHDGSSSDEQRFNSYIEYLEAIVESWPEYELLLDDLRLEPYSLPRFQGSAESLRILVAECSNESIEQCEFEISRPDLDVGALTGRLNGVLERTVVLIVSVSIDYKNLLPSEVVRPWLFPRLR